jgi:hypothetical protein
MLPGTNFGTATRVTATGAACITSGNAYIIGIGFQGTATGIVAIFAGTTATVTTGATYLGRVVAYATTGVTVNPYFFANFPAYCSGGITISNAGSALGSLDVSTTLFWNPAGGA